MPEGLDDRGGDELGKGGHVKSMGVEKMGESDCEGKGLQGRAI